MKRVTIDTGRLVADYLAGKSELALSRDLGISRGPIRARLIEAGVTPRGHRDARLMDWARKTPAQRLAQVDAAHRATRPTVYRRRSLAERFWLKVRKGEGCWEWQGSRSPTTNDWGGYGRIATAVGVRRAHRVSWELHFGEIPAGTLVRHRCDNPPCVRPDHLELGTPHDNNLDMSTRGRSTTGEKNRHAKLTDAQVADIRRSGKGPKEVASRFGISATHAARILNGQTWKHV